MTPDPDRRNPTTPDGEASGAGPTKAGQGAQQSRPVGKGTVELARLAAETERARIEADKAAALAKIAADNAAALARIAAEDDPDPEPPSKVIRNVGIAVAVVIMALTGLVAALYNVPFKGNPLTGEIEIGGQPTQSADPGSEP